MHWLITEGTGGLSGETLQRLPSPGEESDRDQEGAGQLLRPDVLHQGHSSSAGVLKMHSFNLIVRKQQLQAEELQNNQLAIVRSVNVRMDRQGLQHGQGLEEILTLTTSESHLQVAQQDCRRLRSWFQEQYHDCERCLIWGEMWANYGHMGTLCSFTSGFFSLNLKTFKNEKVKHLKIFHGNFQKGGRCY